MPLSSFCRASRLGALGVVVFGLVSLGLASGGCYNPTISPKFKCNKDYAPGAGDCPDGFFCSTSGTAPGVCLKGPPKDAGAQMDVVHVDHPPGDPSMEAPPPPVDTPPVCFQPVQGCTPGAGTCDPVCQTGCGCQEKCLSNTTGTLICSVPFAGRPRALGEGCNKFAPGSATQTDDCMPGLVCMTDGCGDRCYKYCKTDGDCVTSTCTRDAGGGVKICDVPNVACNPITNNQMPDGCGTSSDSLACWLSTAGTDQTFCDCPGAFSIGRPNTTCTATRDCLPGLVCAVTGAGPQCRQACSLTNNSADCQGGVCTVIGNNKKFGYCN
jgi:hypothetical protein